MIASYRVLVILFMLSFSPAAFAQHPDSLLTKEEMRDDLDSLLKTVLASHPQPGGFISSSALDSAFKDAWSNVKSEKSVLDFSLTIAELMFTMHDSHSGMDYGQMQQMSFDGSGYFLPFSCFTQDDKIYIHHDWEEKIPRGSEFIAVNGVSASKLYELSLKYACTEGEATSSHKRIADAIITLITSLYADVDSSNTIDVINFETNEIETFTLKGYTKKEYANAKKLRSEMKENKILDIEFNEDNTRAILKVGTFAPPNSRYYRRYIKHAFEDIVELNCDTVILDLRDNGGGSSSWVEYLYSFLDEKGHNTPSNVIAKNSELAIKRGKILTRGFSKFILRNFFKKNEDVASFLGVIDLPFGQLDTTYFLERTIQKKELIFQGECFLLINGLTASAGVDFTNTFKKNKRGIVVGEACLGPVSGTWGNPAIYTLPNSKLRVSIATIRYNYDNSFLYSPNAIEPDFSIYPTPKGVNEKRDEVLEFVIGGLK